VTKKVVGVFIAVASRYLLPAYIVNNSALMLSFIHFILAKNLENFETNHFTIYSLLLRGGIGILLVVGDFNGSKLH
jgi:hypothetical protein